MATFKRKIKPRKMRLLKGRWMEHASWRNEPKETMLRWSERARRFTRKTAFCQADCCGSCQRALVRVCRGVGAPFRLEGEAAYLAAIDWCLEQGLLVETSFLF